MGIATQTASYTVPQVSCDNRCRSHGSLRIGGRIVGDSEILGSWNERQLQIPPLRCAAVGMTVLVGRASLRECARGGLHGTLLDVRPGWITYVLTVIAQERSRRW